MHHRYIKGIIPYLVCMVVSGLLSCRQDLLDTESNGRVILQPVQYPDPGSGECILDYYYYLFEANINGAKNVPDSEFKLVQKADRALSKSELESLSFQFQNYEIENKIYKLVILGTPSALNETRLVSVSSILEQGSLLSDMYIGMIPDGLSGYRLLSKNNYLTTQSFVGQDIVDNDILTIEMKLKRSVGQLVFDVFKVADHSLSKPVATDDGFGSVLDRIEKIGIKVCNFSTMWSISNNTAVGSTDEKINIVGETVLDGDYLLNPGVQAEDVITGPLSKNNIEIGGSARIYGPYLLPSSGISGLNVLLSFSYYDTSCVNGIYQLVDLDNGLQLKLPSGNKNHIYVEKNCYTVTSIGIGHNRIIDLDTSGNVIIETQWNK